MDNLLAITVRIQTALHSAMKSERGQGTLEYIGMVAVAGVLALGIIAAAGGVDLKGKFGTAITSIFGGGGAAAPAAGNP